MKSMIQLINDYQNKVPEACGEILVRMSPLAKKYAAKIHCMEYDDALQELYVALLESMTHLNVANSEGECIKYMATSVINRYNALCKHYLSIPFAESIDDSIMNLPSDENFDDTKLDIEIYIRTLPVSGYRRDIFILFFYKNMSDKKIADTLHISRQYVNRIKKILIKEYFSKSKKSPV